MVAMPPKSMSNKEEAEEERGAKRKEPEVATGAEEPAEKEARTDAAEVEEELEKDAPKDSRATLKEPVAFYTADTTMNVVPSFGGKLLATLTDGGMQYLIAGARANTGVKAGRYMFETKVVEALTPAETWSRTPAPKPRQLLRFGFSTAASPLVLGDGEEHVCFDSEGAFWAGRAKSQASTKFGRDQVIAVVLNLDPKSPNANTLSAFIDGKRVSKPQPIPESLHGKTLYPHVSYRNISVQVHFGPVPLKTLPFACRSVAAAAQKDAEVRKSSAPKDGKYEVVFPVGYPDEGTFAWLDSWLEKNPGFTELSDRKILEWAASSGLVNSGSRGAASGRHCLDKPSFGFGIPGMDDYSVRRTLNSIACALPRHFVVMEVKQNLMAGERRDNLKRFALPHFRKVAHVAIGEPPAEFKKVQHAEILKVKQDRENSAHLAKQVEKRRKKELVAVQKRIEESRKKVEAEVAARKAEEGKKEEVAPKKEEDDVKKEEGDEKKADMEVDEETVKKEAAEVKEEVKKEPESDGETEAPKAELTEEEKKQWFHRGLVSDITSYTMDRVFMDFSIPEEAEGFDAISYDWANEADAKAYLKNKLSERKRTCKMEGLMPSEWFQSALKEWQKVFADWREKQSACKSDPPAPEKKEGDDAEANDEEKKPTDISKVEDIFNVDGAPIFKAWEMEDWALLQLRFELFLLQAAFKKDVNDEEHPGIHDTNVSFYYNKYFRKQLTPRHFGTETVQELLELIPDTVAWASDILVPKLECDVADHAALARHVESARRVRQRRLAVGDEGARLKVESLALSQPAAAAHTSGGIVGGRTVPPRQSWTPVGGGGKGGHKGSFVGKAPRRW